MESYLRANPADAARVRAIVADNRAIRALYAGELERPVPERLLRAARPPERRPVRQRMAAAVAACAMLALAATGGWLVGREGGVREGGGGPLAELLRAVALHQVDMGTGGSGIVPADGDSGALPDAHARMFWIEAPAPDLVGHGFVLAERSPIPAAGGKTMRFVYRSPDGTLNLFLGLRRDAQTTAIQETRMGDLAVFHWSEGPVAYAVTTDVAPSMAAQLARQVREAIRPGRFVEPPPSALAGPGGAGAGDAVRDALEPAPEEPRPSQFN